VAGSRTVTWTPRLIEPDELDSVIDLLAVAFGAGPTAPEDMRTAATTVAERDRMFVVEDDGRFVGTAAAYTLTAALPGGEVGMCGLTMVSVLPTHRRRGLLTTLIEAVHDQALERGEPLAGLTASEGGIYRRFGYGVAARRQELRVDARRTAQVAVSEAVTGGTPAGVPGRMRLVAKEEADTILPDVWDRHWRRTPGELDRTPPFWVEAALESDHVKAGASERFVAVHEDPDGRPDGFVTYRIKQEWTAGGTNHECRVQMLGAASDAVEDELLRFLFAIDLVGTITWDAAPVDLPLRWRLADPRAVTVTDEADHLWLRPLDVPRCLAARRYALKDELVVTVVDDRRPTGGTFLLAGGPDGAECAPTDRSADLVVGVADLGSVLAGGTTWRTLQRAGRIREDAAGAVDRADALFRPERAAWCATEF
jgi:predicted acetyltransferase